MRDKFFNVGVFLAGLGVFLVSLLFIYIELMPSFSYSKKPLIEATCKNGFLTVRSEKEIKGLKVESPLGNTLCTIQEVDPNHDALCELSEYSYYRFENGTLVRVYFGKDFPVSLTFDGSRFVIWCTFDDEGR